MTLYITRHGQTNPEKEGLIKNVDYPAGDPPITGKGMRQAALLGEKLKKSGFSGIVYSSPYYSVQ